ncbi:MAG: hypothetical protein GC187_04845 [Alphaproteobacteria bacterium]|nr:hypothetical protein [Alphaproteobacteria bacterium]
MSGLVTIPARPGALVPTRRTARVEPAPSAAGAGEEARDRACSPRRSPGAPHAASPISADGAAFLQAGPARRGLRADACERRRYHAAYEAAVRLSPARPAQQERAA